MFKQFDIVQIITTKSIKYLSGPEGHVTSPHGNWSIIGFVGQDCILAKENTLVRVPQKDIRRVANYDLDALFKKISAAGYLKPELINMPDHVSKVLDLNIAEARKLLVHYKFKLEVKTVEERDSITERVQASWQRRKNQKTENTNH